MVSKLNLLLQGYTNSTLSNIVQNWRRDSESVYNLYNNNFGFNFKTSTITNTFPEYLSKAVEYNQLITQGRGQSPLSWSILPKILKNNSYINFRNLGYSVAPTYGYYNLFGPLYNLPQIISEVGSYNANIQPINYNINEYGGIDSFIPYNLYFSTMDMFDYSGNILNNSYNSFAIYFASDDVSSFFTYHNLNIRKWNSTIKEMGPIPYGAASLSPIVEGKLNRLILLETNSLDRIFFNTQTSLNNFLNWNNTSSCAPLVSNRLIFFPYVGAVVLGDTPNDVPFFSTSPRYMKLNNYAYPANKMNLPTGQTVYPRVILSITKNSLMGVGIAYDAGQSPYSLMNNVSTEAEIKSFCDLWGKLAYYGGWAIEKNDHTNFIEFYDTGIINDLKTPAGTTYLLNTAYDSFRGDSVNIFMRYVSDSGIFRAVGIDSNALSVNNGYTVFLEVGFSYALPVYVRNFSRGFLA